MKSSKIKFRIRYEKYKGFVVEKQFLRLFWSSVFVAFGGAKYFKEFDMALNALRYYIEDLKKEHQLITTYKTTYYKEDLNAY
jgi:hypothetical protein